MLAAGRRALLRTPNGVEDAFIEGAAVTGGSVTERTVGIRGLVGFAVVVSACSVCSPTSTASTASTFFSEMGDDPSLEAIG